LALCCGSALPLLWSAWSLSSPWFSPSLHSVNIGTSFIIDGSSTYLTTGQVFVWHSLSLQVLLELYWCSAWSGNFTACPISWSGWSLLCTSMLTLPPWALHWGSVRLGSFSAWSGAFQSLGWVSAWHLFWSAWSMSSAGLIPNLQLFNTGTFIILDGSSTYLTTGQVIVWHSLTFWVLLELWML
jgi:hypothetical protein